MSQEARNSYCIYSFDYWLLFVASLKIFPFSGIFSVEVKYGRKIFDVGQTYFNLRKHRLTLFIVNKPKSPSVQVQTTHNMSVHVVRGVEFSELRRQTINVRFKTEYIHSFSDGVFCNK